MCCCFIFSYKNMMRIISLSIPTSILFDYYLFRIQNFNRSAHLLSPQPLLLLLFNYFVKIVSCVFYLFVLYFKCNKKCFIIFHCSWGRSLKCFSYFCWSVFASTQLGCYTTTTIIIIKNKTITAKANNRVVPAFW